MIFLTCEASFSHGCGCGSSNSFITFFIWVKNHSNAFFDSVDEVDWGVSSNGGGVSKLSALATEGLGVTVLLSSRTSGLPLVTKEPGEELQTRQLHGGTLTNSRHRTMMAISVGVASQIIRTENKYFTLHTYSETDSITTHTRAPTNPPNLDTLPDMFSQRQHLCAYWCV